MRNKLNLIVCTVWCSYVSAQVQNISGWTLDTFDGPDITVGGITYLNNFATPLTVTTSVGTYDAGTAGAGADDVFIRRNTATPSGNANTPGQAIMGFTSTGGSTTLNGTYNATMKDLLLGGNVLNATFDTFANADSGATFGHNIERVDFVWSNGYTTIGDEVIIVFNYDPVGAQDDFRVAVFTSIDGSADKLPTAYANTGVLVTGTNYPDKLPLPFAGNPLSSNTTGFRTTATDDLSGTAVNIVNTGANGIGGVAISLATLGISAGQTIYGYSLISADTNATSAANLLDFTNNSIYPTSTPNADASGTTDFSTFGGRIASIQNTGALGAFEWDNGNGNSKWGSTIGGEANSNWFSTVVAENNRTPIRDSDVIFGAIPSTNQTVDLDNNVEVRKMTFDADVNYTIGISGDTPTITLGDPNLAGGPSIEVGNTFRDGLQHKINSNLVLVEALAINNNAYSTLCINGFIETRSTLFPAGNTITVDGIGAVNFNGDISGSGDLVKLGSGIATINNNNSDDPAGSTTQWLGNVSVSGGQLVITADGALGGSADRTNNLARVAGNTTLQLANANAADLKVGQLVTGTGIPADTYITNISIGGSNTTVTLSKALTGAVTNTATITFAGVTSVTNGASLTLRGGVNYTTAETINIEGDGTGRLPAENTGAIFNDGGNNTLGTNVTLRLTGDAGINSRADNLTINGLIREATPGQALVKTGEGVVTLGNAANSYTGATIIRNGALRITTETALPGGFATGGASGGNLQLNGGVLEIATGGTFTRSLGTGSDQVQFTSDGGFSAFGSTGTVTLGTAPVWATGSFLADSKALLLSSAYSNATVNFTNAIDLNGAVREVRVANGSAAVDAQLTGILSNGGLNKSGAGTLELTANNTYTGETQISGGALRVAAATVIDGSDLVLNGGVLEINGDLDGINTGEFTRSVGTTAADDVRWTGDGGFSASTANRTVRLNNGTAALTWGGASPTPGFIGAGNTLILGSVSSGNTVTFANGLFLDGTGDRTIRAVAGTTAGIANGTLSGVVSGAANLAVTGNGRLGLTANNTHTGAVTITGAEVRLSTNVGDLAQSSGFTVRQGGTLSLDNTTNTVNTTDRLGNAAAISLQGGTLNLYGRTGNNNTTETVGAVTLSSGANTLNAGYGDNTGSAQLTLSSLTRSGSATVNFTNLTAAGTAAGTLGSTGDNSRILVTGLANTNSIVGGWATVGDNWATEISDTLGIGALGTYETSTTPANWAATENISIGADATNDATRTVNTFRLNGAGGARTLDLDNNATNRAFTVSSGGILSVGAVTNIIRADNAGSTLNAGGTGDLIVHTQGATNTLQINAQIANNGGGNGLTKAGDGTLQLGGTMANTYTGLTTVNAGTLVLAKSDNITAIAGNLTIGDGRGIDTVRLGANEQIADSAIVTLRGGELGNSANVARLELNGSTNISTPSRIETFNTLTVTGNSVLDFGGGNVCSPTFLYLDFLTVASNSLLTITNWIEFTDFLLVEKATFDESQLARIIFDGYPGTARFTNYDGTYWQITPVPEPSSYGALALSALSGFYLSRRKRRSA